MARFPLMVVRSLMVLGICSGAYSYCNYGSIGCATTMQCLNKRSICNGIQDCYDNSDEDICIGNKLRVIPSTTTTTATITTTTTTTPAPTPPPPNNVEESEALGQKFARTFNDTLHHPSCPKLYTSVGNKCLSLLYFVKVGWGEARALCSAVGGELVRYPSASDGEFTALLKYLREIQMTTDFWVGGRYTKDTEAWAWLDDAPMDLGSPYWAVRHTDSCSSRQQDQCKTASLRTSPTGPTLRPATTTSRRPGATPTSSAPPSPSATTSTLATRTASASGALCVNMFPAPLMTSRLLAIRDHCTTSRTLFDFEYFYHESVMLVSCI